MHINILYQKTIFPVTSVKLTSFLLFTFIIFNPGFTYSNNIFFNKWLKNFPDIDNLYNGKAWTKTEEVFLSSALGKQCQNSPDTNKNHSYIANNNYIGTYWNIKPLKLQFSFKNHLLDKIRINLWNKGDAALKKAPNMKAFRIISTFLEEIKQSDFQVTKEVKKISSKYRFNLHKIIIGESVWEIQLEPNEYIIIDIKPYKPQKKLNIVEQHIQNSKRIDRNQIKKSFRQNLVLNVQKKPNGDIIIKGIPMIDQGQKGYCTPATCARILQYYGYDLDEHQIANLMGTKKGTNIKNMREGLKMISSGLPFFAKELKFSFSTIKRYILKGTPLIWGIPRHIRMIIGINENKKQIIYSDSWGTKGIENKMPYKRAKNITNYLGVLK